MRLAYFGLGLCLIGCSTIVSSPPGLDEDLEGAEGEGSESEEEETTGDTFVWADDTDDTSGSGPDPDVDPSVQGCSPISPSLVAEGPDMSLSGFAVSSAAVSMFGFGSSSGLSGVQFASGTEIPPIVQVRLRDSSGTTRCTVFFDASNASPVATPSTLAADAWVGWTIPLTGQQARAFYSPPNSPPGTPPQRCPPLSEAFAGSASRDPRDFAAAQLSPLGFGLGPLTGTHRDDIQNWLIDGGEDWATDWAPYAFAAHMSTPALNQGVAQPWGLGIRYQSQCEVLDEDAQGDLIPQPHPNTSWPGGVMETFGLYVIEFSAP